MHVRLRLAAALLAAAPLVALAPAARADEPDLPALLKRLGAHAEAARRAGESISMTCTDRQEEIDGDGKVKGWYEAVSRVTRAGGREVEEIKRATEDGKDVTEEARKELAEKSAGKGDKGATITVKMPFRPEEQGKYAFTLKGPAPGDPSKLLIHFAPAGKPATELLVGHALVDPVKGEVLKMTSRPSKYPTFVSNGSGEIDYGATPFGPVIVRSSFQGEGGILFLRKRVRGTKRCYDFAAAPGAPPPAP
jgi:hypothetical protein